MVSCLDAVWHYIASIHPTVVASLIAFIGIAGSLWINRIEQRRDQFLQLRRDVYVSAADAFAGASLFAAHLHDPGVRLMDGGNIIRQLSGTLGKIHILGGKEVIATASALHTKFFDYYRGQMKKKGLADPLEDKINYNIEAIRLIWRKAMESPDLLNKATSAVDRLVHENKPLEMELYRLRLEMLSATLAFQEQIAPYSAQAVLALKRELGIDVNEPWYVEMVQLSEQASVEKHRQYISETKGEQSADR